MAWRRVVARRPRDPEGAGRKDATTAKLYALYPVSIKKRPFGVLWAREVSEVLGVSWYVGCR